MANIKNIKALLRLLEESTKGNVAPSPGLQEKTGKALLVPRPKSLEARPGPTSGTSTIGPTESSVFFDPKMNTMSEDEIIALLARGQAELNEQNIGAISPLIAPKQEFFPSGVVRDTDDFVPATGASPNRFIDPDEELARTLGFPPGSQPTVGAGHATLAQADPLTTLRQRIAEFSVKSRAPEIARGRNATADFEQGSNFVRSKLAGRGGFEPFDFEQDFIPQDAFTRANEQLKALLNRVEASAGANPSIVRSRQLGPSSPNFAAQKGLDLQQQGIIQNLPEGAFLEDFLNALRFSRQGEPKGISEFGVRERLRSESPDIRQPSGVAGELETRLKEVKRSTSPPDKKIIEEKAPDLTKEQAEDVLQNRGESFPTIEEAAEELGLTVEEAMDALRQASPKRARPIDRRR